MIVRRLLLNTALIVSRLTFYAAFDAMTFSLTANGEISYLGALGLINVLPAPGVVLKAVAFVQVDTP